MIQNRLNEGAFLKDIAAELGVSTKTVSRAVKRNSAPTGKPGRPKVSKLDPFVEQINELLARNVWNAQVILRELQSRGYSGSVSLLREYIAPKRALRPSRATVRFETPPGKQMQSDWAELRTMIAGVDTKVFFCVNELGHSRAMHIWAALSFDAHHTFEAMVRAFEYFGGIPAQVLVDNQKAAVIEHPREGEIRFNNRFLDMADFYGFKPKACKPARPQTKGKVERMVSYLKGHFFVRYQQFESLAHLNQQLEQWLRTEAEPRVHGTTREVVQEMFKRELPYLQALPNTRFDTAYIETRRVGWDGYIDVNGNRYSVPSNLAGQSVRVYIGLEGTLRVANMQDQWVASHTLRHKSSGWVVDSSHHKPLWEKTMGKVQARPLSVYEEML
tara:strand:+ start:135 stop:1295 length:1161 start_codon:yes stop_codon:yes gene_type:complete